MTTVHTLGFPRIGAGRELKHALETYWRGESDRADLERSAAALRRRHWLLQKAAGVDRVPVGDFSLYDHVLDLSLMLGVVPERFRAGPGARDPDIYFRMARGRAPTGADAMACDMTKWFDTNYHYLVPEIDAATRFSPDASALVAQVEQARNLGLETKPALVGPVTYLWLARGLPPGERLKKLPALLDAYAGLLNALHGAGCDWIQLDEPILALELDGPWQKALRAACDALSDLPVRILLATYFDDLGDNLTLARELPTDGLHVDLARGPEDLDALLRGWPRHRVLSAGIVDGRNVWRNDLRASLALLAPAADALGDRLWLAPSCSLLHVPMDREQERRLPDGLRNWLAFAVQKLDELDVLRRALDAGQETVADALESNQRALDARRGAAGTRIAQVRQRLAGVEREMLRRRRGHSERTRAQQCRLGLPRLPTTTIGSFPQTGEIRRTRRDYRAGRIDRAAYEQAMRAEIANVIREQETLGLDVLVHGEPERNDMVEYFGEHLAGVAVTDHGWVQSYGSRCVKPPIIHGDIHRPRPITVDWIRYAGSLTDKPVKGMLTGPVTILKWSFVRDDQPIADTARQIALALRDEVQDLERAGVPIIQMDEAAFREAMPLDRAKWEDHLAWAVDCFRLASSGVADETQIHTHMCYSEFNDILPAIADMDADVITIETARSRMALLAAFREFDYPNEIGPGVYDIHAPLVPEAADMEILIRDALAVVPAERLWVNPDCGLKTRTWDEIRPALANLVAAAANVRSAL